MTAGVLCVFPTVPWVGLQCVILVCPDHFSLTVFMYVYRMPCGSAVAQC